MIVAAHDAWSLAAAGRAAAVIDRKIVARAVEQGVQHAIQVERRLGIAGKSGIGMAESASCTKIVKIGTRPRPATTDQDR